MKANAQLAGEARQAVQIELGSVGRFKLGRMIRSSSRRTDDSIFTRIINHEIENIIEMCNEHPEG